jgi:hypothetical protein
VLKYNDTVTSRIRDEVLCILELDVRNELTAECTLSWMPTVYQVRWAAEAVWT